MGLSAVGLWSSIRGHVGIMTRMSFLTNCRFSNMSARALKEAEDPEISLVMEMETEKV